VAGSLAQDASDPTRYTAKATFAGPGSGEVADAAVADLADNEGAGDSLAVQVVGTPKTTASLARAALTPWKAGTAETP
jgi:hypothetical protein